MTHLLCPISFAGKKSVNFVQSELCRMLQIYGLLCSYINVTISEYKYKKVQDNFKILVYSNLVKTY